MTNTISLKEVYSKYQPIVKSNSKWELETLVSVILKRYTTATGKVTYLVKFRDGSTSKVSARSLYKRNADLIEIFEHKRLLALESPDEDEGDDNIPSKRTYSEIQQQLPPPTLKKAKKKPLTKKAKSATSSPSISTPHIPSSLRSSSLPPQPEVPLQPEISPQPEIAPQPNNRIVLKRPLVVASIHSNECYHCSKGESQTPATPLAPCNSCTFSFHPSCNDDEATCLLCRTHGSDCMLCNKQIENDDDEQDLMIRCKECSRAMHEECTADDKMCCDCQDNRDKMIEKCLGERNDKILVKWRNQSYGCIEWVPRTWIQFKYPEVYKDYLTSGQRHDVDKDQFGVDRVLDVVWHDRNEPNHVLLLYKNMKKEEAIWEAPPKQSQAYEDALMIYKENNSNTNRNNEHNKNR